MIVPGSSNKIYPGLPSATNTFRLPSQRCFGHKMRYFRSPTVPIRSSLGSQSQGVVGRPYTSTPAEGIALKLAQANAEPGDYWLIEKDGEEPWPGVICDEDMVANYLNKKERPTMARRANGEWPKEVRPHGKTPGEKIYPMLYLGRLKFCWVPWKRLQPIDYQNVTEKRDATGDPILKNAYRDILDAPDLDYWKDKVIARRLQDEMDSSYESHKRKQDSEDRTKLKRTRTSAAEFKVPPGLKFAENEDDDESHLAQPVRIKREQDIFIGGLSEEEIDALYEDPVSEDVPQYSYTESLSARLSKSFATPATTPVKSTVKLNPDMVKVYVGNPHRIFHINCQSLKESNLLFQSMKRDSDGWYLMNPRLSDIDVNEFSSVAEYLDHLEFKPNLLDEGTNFARLENISSQPQRSETIVQCGVLYNLAKKLELAGLQSLCFRKFKALGTLPPRELLLVLRLVFLTDPLTTEPAHDYLIDYVADHYYQVWKAESTGLLGVLMEHPQLAKAVHRRLAGFSEVKEDDLTDFEEKFEEKFGDLEEPLFMPEN